MTKYVYLPSGEILSPEEWAARKEDRPFFVAFGAITQWLSLAEYKARARQQEHSVLSPE